MATPWELYRVSVPSDLQRDTSSRQLRPLTPVTIYTGKSVPNISRYIGHGKSWYWDPETQSIIMVPTSRCGHLRARQLILVSILLFTVSPLVCRPIWSSRLQPLDLWWEWTWHTWQPSWPHTVFLACAIRTITVSVLISQGCHNEVPQIE